MKSFVPAYNSLSWFEVCDASHHQVCLPVWHTVVIILRFHIFYLWRYCFTSVQWQIFLVKLNMMCMLI